MTIEVFSQLTAQNDQLQQQYALRKRFCIDHLGWEGRTVHKGLEYDEYDHPFAIYMIWRDEQGTARGMARFTQCNLPYMIRDHWPHLVTDIQLPKSENQWEATRLCIEQGQPVARILSEIMIATEIMAEKLNISEYWWLSPKERIDTILAHNHQYAGPGEQIGDEFCFVGWSKANAMVHPKYREVAAQTTEISFEIAA